MKKLLVCYLFLASMIYSQDSFFIEEPQEEESSLANFSVGGNLEVGSLYIDETFYSITNGVLEGEYRGGIIDLFSTINVELLPLDSIRDFPLQDNGGVGEIYFDTFYLRYYHNYFDIEAGLLKPVWGSGDGIHVVDYLTPIDYRDPFEPSYLERKISQEMIKVNVPIGDRSLIEGVYKPRFKGDSIAMSGPWTPDYIKSLDSKLFSIMYPIALSINPLTPEEAVRNQAEALAENIDIESGEFFVASEAALRFTITLSSFDLGLIYYWGHLKTPTMDPQRVIENGEIELYYNRVHSFGLDFGGQLGMFNLKGEVSYNLTDDFQGDDPAILNNSMGYLAGFDINIPLNNLNILLQGVGKITINSSEIDELDPEYSEGYRDFMILGRISDNYLYETLHIEVGGSYDFIDQDFLLSPVITYDYNDSLSLEGKYILFEGDESTDFGQFNDNDLLRISAKLTL